jgi:hypothetical protein
VWHTCSVQVMTALGICLNLHDPSHLGHCSAECIFLLCLRSLEGLMRVLSTLSAAQQAYAQAHAAASKHTLEAAAGSALLGGLADGLSGLLRSVQVGQRAVPA